LTSGTLINHAPAPTDSVDGYALQNPTTNNTFSGNLSTTFGWAGVAIALQPSLAGLTNPIGQRVIDMTQINTYGAFEDQAGGIYYHNVPVTYSVSAGGYLPSDFVYYVSVPNLNQLYIYNGITNTQLAGSPVNIVSGAQGTLLGGLAGNPFTNLMYVLAGNGTVGYRVLVYSGTTQTANIFLSLSLIPSRIVVNPYTNLIYVTMSNGTVDVINGYSNTITAIVTVGTNPIGIDVNPITNTIYVANSGSNSVSVINGATNTVTATITGSFTAPISVSVNRNTNLIYVANSGSIAVINGATNTATIPSGFSGYSNFVYIVVNPNTNMIYVNTTADTYVFSGYGNVFLAQVSLLNTSQTVIFAFNTVTNNLYFYDLVGGTTPEIIIVNTVSYTTSATASIATNTDSYIALLYQDPKFAVYNGNNNTNFQVHAVNGSFNGGGIQSFAGGALMPQQNNGMNLGEINNRWTAVYATLGTIQTSTNKLKTNIKEIDKKKALEIIRKLKPVKWNWNHLPKSYNDHTNVGFIIEDIRESHPQFEGLYHEEGINYASFNSYFIGALQELNDQLNSVSRELLSTKAEIASFISNRR
jgi:YVTN family beta-propeller protein